LSDSRFVRGFKKGGETNPEFHPLASDRVMHRVRAYVHPPPSRCTQRARMPITREPGIRRST
jgi:hypothetical protein